MALRRAWARARASEREGWGGRSRYDLGMDGHGEADGLLDVELEDLRP